MDEEETQQETNSEEESQDSEAKEEVAEEGETPSEASDLLTRANAAADRLQQENAKMKENLKKVEQIQAEQIVRGTALGNMMPEKKEESPEEYAQKVLEGKENPLLVDGKLL